MDWLIDFIPVHIEEISHLHILERAGGLWEGGAFAGSPDCGWDFFEALSSFVSLIKINLQLCTFI